jgi:outer membrane protein OmpA-like peptidoglycan-associated protein
MKFNVLFNVNDVQNVEPIDYLKRIGIKNVEKYFDFNSIEVDKNYSNKLEDALCLVKKYKDRDREIKILVDS